MLDDENVGLLIEWESEVDRWRRRAAFLFILVLQAVFLLLLAFEPQLFISAARMIGMHNVHKHPMQTTMLTFPTAALRRRAPAPKPPAPLKSPEIAAERAPKIVHKALNLPYLRPKTPAPKPAQQQKNTPPAAAKPAPQVLAQTTPPPPKPKLEAQLRLQDVRPPRRIHMPGETPGEAIQQSLRAAAAGAIHGENIRPSGPSEQFQRLRASLNMAGPVILSNTQGVDFNPYIRQIYYIIERNWYAVMPESVYLGEKGHAALVVEILKDGSVGELRLILGSGKKSLDLAALASIKASNPFPPLPKEFTGKHLVLEFGYFYNERVPN